MSTVPQTIAGWDGSTDHSRLSANRPRSVLMARLLIPIRGALARNLTASLVVWSTTVRRLTTYTSRRGASAPAARASSQTATTLVLPTPVGRLQDRGTSPAMKRPNSAVCQGNGRFPVNAQNLCSKSNVSVPMALLSPCVAASFMLPRPCSPGTSGNLVRTAETAAAVRPRSNGALP